MASSVDHNKLPNICGGATAAPPPTPSSQTNHLSTSAAAEALSRLLHRLPPKLSLPTRRSSSVISPPTISFSDSPDDEFSSRLLSAVSEFGFFQITDHKISSHLVLSAESESAALFDIQAEKKEALFPKDWGFIGDEDEESDGAGESFCFDPRLCLPYSDEICLQALQELVPAMEYLGLKIVEHLFRAIGLENPIGEDRSRFRSLIWISKGSRSAEPAVTCGFYPYIVGLHYQSKNQRCSVLGDSGWVATAATAADSVMVSIGDIAQVWSNGKVKKVRGRAVAAAADGSDNSGTISISLLITLPLDTQVSPLLPPTDENTDAEAEEDGGGGNEAEKKTAVFRSFSFEEYAWKVYQNRCFLLRDPLAGYRI
ncbi:Gibberellin 2-beta-dioxygenase 2 [Cucurbita argyrosperma subsp. argyrosperma]|uniref:Gibberellin 3-beta-dioxygenase 4 n=2 Tax=Cucurbita TaxID=3660 RepID=A0A6J1FRA7_CUCMO